MTGDQSRTLRVGDRVYWHDDLSDQGVITEKNWAGVTIKWDNRDQQAILHNDMTTVFLLPNKTGGCLAVAKSYCLDCDSYQPCGLFQRS